MLAVIRWLTLVSAVRRLAGTEDDAASAFMWKRERDNACIRYYIYVSVFVLVCVYMCVYVCMCVRFAPSVCDQPPLTCSTLFLSFTPPSSYFFFSALCTRRTCSHNTGIGSITFVRKHGRLHGGSIESSDAQDLAGSTETKGTHCV